MREVHVVDQAGSVGFVSPSDRRGFELHPQAWTSMNAVRMDEGAVEPAWGYDGGVLALEDHAHALDFMTSLDGAENYYIIADQEDIHAVWVNASSGVLSKKSIGTGYTGVYDSGNVWVTTFKDGHLVLTNGKNAPQMVLRDDISTLAAAPLTGFTDAPIIGGQPAYTHCGTIISFNGFLVAGNIGFSGTENKPNAVAWSDRSDTGAIPASWDYSDNTTLAGYTTLPSDYGAVVALEEIRDELMVYCERGAYRMQFVGGQYVFRIVPAFDTVGAVGPRAVCSNKGTNIIVSHTDIVRSDGQYPVSIANGTVRKELFDQLSPANSHKVQVVEYPAKSEILIICPDKAEDEWCGKVLAWNWITETWAVRHGLLMRCLANVPKLVSSLDPENWHAQQSYDEIYRWGRGITDGTTTPPSDEQLNDVTGEIVSTPEDQPLDNYDLMQATFGSLLADEGALYMFGIATEPDDDHPSEPVDALSNSLWQFDGGQLAYAHSVPPWERPTIERRGINLTNDESVQIVTAVYPKMEGSGNINVFIGAVDYIGGRPSAIRWDGPVTFNPEKDYRVTCRVVGRRHAIKFEAVPEVDENGASLRKYQNFRLAGYDIEYSQAGRR